MMKRIIAAVDFSKTSAAAARYAAWLSQIMGSKMELVHVSEFGTGDYSLHNWKKLEDQMIATDNREAANLMSTICNLVDINFKRITGGPFQDVISDYAAKSKADIVVIGSQGASRVKKILFGSNTFKLLERCPVPLVVIPPDTEFDGIKKIIYATDMTHLDEEIKAITRFAKIFDAEVIVLHITREDASKRDRSDLKEIIKRMTGYKKIDLKFLAKSDIAVAIEDEIAEIKPDMMAMFIHQHTIVDKIFGKGITRQLAFLNRLPLLIINRTTFHS
jgi:nucleotide-binding universal stress UspA family protein